MRVRVIDALRKTVLVFGRSHLHRVTEAWRATPNREILIKDVLLRGGVFDVIDPSTGAPVVGDLAHVQTGRRQLALEIAAVMGATQDEITAVLQEINDGEFSDAHDGADGNGGLFPE